MRSAEVKRILFVCVHNAGRSQMAEAFFKRMAKGKARGFSAGTRPAKEVHPVVVEAMREVGVDVSGRKPKMLTFEMLKSADRVIAMEWAVMWQKPVRPGLFPPRTGNWMTLRGNRSKK